MKLHRIVDKTQPWWIFSPLALVLVHLHLNLVSSFQKSIPNQLAKLVQNDDRTRALSLE